MGMPNPTVLETFRRRGLVRLPGLLPMDLIRRARFDLLSSFGFLFVVVGLFAVRNTRAQCPKANQQN